MTCSDLDAALRTLTAKVYQDAAPPGETDYIVWSVYGFTLVVGDDGVQIRIPKVQIDAYCQSAGAALTGGLFDLILDELDALPLCYSMQDVGYDHDAAAMRMIVQCEVV